MESTIAYFPRIIMDIDVFKTIAKRKSRVINHLVKDADGIMYMDFLSYTTSDGILSLKRNFLQAFVNNREIAKDDARALQKIAWLETYVMDKIIHAQQDKVNKSKETFDRKC